MKRHSRRNVIPTRKMGKGLLIPLEIMERLDNIGMAKFFCHFFSPLAKWCSFLGKSDSLLSFRGNVWGFFFSHSYEDVVLQQNDVVLQESPLSFFSLTRTSFFVREKKLNGLSFRTTSFCFRTTSSYYVSEKKTQTFPLQDKRESDFPSRLHHFAAGEKNWQKNLASLGFPILPWSLGE